MPKRICSIGHGRPAAAGAGILLIVVAACVGTAPSLDTSPSGGSAGPLPSSTVTAPSPSPAGSPVRATPIPTPGLTPTEPPLGAAPVGPVEWAVVLRVIDGDTIEIDRGHGPERVRYIGIDSPETVDPSSPVEWMGPEASAANAALVEGRRVVLERDVSETDRYGRLLRYVWLEDPSSPTGWLLVNLALVGAGFAQVATYPPDVRYVDLLLAAQEEARAAGRGLWAPEPASTPTPKAAPKPTPTPTSGGDCDPSYPTVCIPPPPPDLDCRDIPYRRFQVLPPDPHRFDGDHDGIGCESV